MRKEYVGISPEGYEEIELLPQQTGLSGPRYITVEKEIVQRSIDPETGEDRALPRISKTMYDKRSSFPLFVPRTEAEANNLIAMINKERAKENKNPITVSQFNYVSDQLANALQAQEAVVEEMQRRENPYKYYVKKFKDGYDPQKHREAIEGSSSIFQLFRDPKKFAANKYTALNQMIRNVIPGSRNDFVLAGDVAGSMLGFKGARAPGAPKAPKSVADEILEGSIFKTTAGATLGGTAASLTYDLVNAGIRKTMDIPNPQDAPNAALEAMTHGRNTLLFTGGAAGLMGVASTLRPMLGSALFGLDGPKQTLANFADMYNVPIGISQLSRGAGGVLSPVSGSFFQVIGKLPFFGAGFTKRNTLAGIQLTKGMKKELGDLGSGQSDDALINYIATSYKSLPRAVRKAMDTDARNAGFRSYKDMINAELRVNELAPIQHMTDVGAFMFEEAGKRYRQFAYINDLLYQDFENKAKKISKNFIPTNNTKAIAQNIRDELQDSVIKLDNYNEFKPQFDQIENFIVDTVANLPAYIKPKDIRVLQREINRLYQEAEALIGPAAKKQGTPGGSYLAKLRKALTTDLNDYANWAPGLSGEEKVLAESAKKSLYRANEVFAKMSPIYKSPAAKQFNLVDQNLFTAGPDLPGYFYSDEIGKILFRDGLTPQRVRDYEALVGKTAFMAGVRSWINNGFKAALKDSPEVTLKVPDPSGKNSTISITEKIMDIDRFKQNINMDDEGFIAMMDIAGYNGKAFVDNMKQLVKLQEMVKEAGIGTSTSQLIARRLSLGGVRSAANTFAIFGSGAYGATQIGEGNIVPGGTAGAIMLGLLTRRTSRFLSTPDSLKAYTKIVDPEPGAVVKRATLVNFLRGFFRNEDVKENLPKEFNTPEKVVKNPEGFLDYLYNSEYLAVTDSVNDGFLRDYMNERYGDDLDLNIGNLKNIESEESELEEIESGKKTFIPSEPTMDMPEIPSMGGDSMFETDMAMNQQPVQLNPDQRVALASGDLDEAIALRNRS